MDVVRLPDRETCSWVVRMTTDIPDDRWDDRRLGPAASGLAIGEMLPAGIPSHATSMLLSTGEQPYEGRGDEVVLTAPMGGMWRHEVELGTPVWMWDPEGWKQIGDVLEEVEDPAWTRDWLEDYSISPSRRRPTPFHPEARRAVPKRIEQVWVRDDDVTLLVEGIHGVAHLLQHLVVEEHVDKVVLTALVGWWPDIADRLDRGEGVPLLLMGIGWFVQTTLARPLGTRRLLDGSQESSASGD